MNINYYLSILESNAESLKKLTVINRLLLTGKITAFLTSLFFFYNCFHLAEPILTGILAAISFILFVVLAKIDLKYRNKRYFYQSLNTVLQNEVKSLKGDFSSFNDGESFVNKKHEYTFDLDLFGSNSFFHRINRTVTAEGQKILAHMLEYLPENKQEIIHKQEAIDEIAKLTRFRFDFMAIGTGVNSSLKLISDYIPKTKTSSYYSSSVAGWFILISITLTALSTIAAFFHIISVWVPSCLFTIQLILPVVLYKKTNKDAAEIGRLSKNFHGYFMLLSLINQQEFQSELNQKLTNKLFDSKNSLNAFKELSSLLDKFEQRENAYVFVLFNGLYLRDLLLLRQYEKWKIKYASHIDYWLKIIGEFDALISLANHAFNNQDYITPIITTQSDLLMSAEDLGHPFITKKNLVSNSICIKKDQINIITGANMSGKSTFLRTIGINYIMALNGMKVCASAFEIDLVKVFSSMRNSDDLTTGTSYFSAELDRMEQLIHFTEQNKHSLLLLDEILKGTNSNDKLNGSRLFLKEIRKKHVTGLIATHDLALTKLEEQYPGIYKNYCFEFEMADDIIYTYKIQEGISTNLNATYLLSKILFKKQPQESLLTN